MKTLCLTACALALGASVAACANQTPPELKNARTAYQEAVQCPGAALAATDVYEAKKSLDVAERAFNDDGDVPETRDLAYVSQRKAQIARSKCNTALAMQQQNEAVAELARIKQQQDLATRQQLGQTKEQLQRSQMELESERRARAVAEQNTQAALQKIQGLTTKLDQRGLVMTLSGTVLFATGKATLLPGAQKRLADVAAALKDDKRSLTIVGHTDSVGDPQKNEALSQRRADSVRAYLTAHGVPEGRVKTEGVGETQPIADNKTPEGRANNRRVEMILGEPVNGMQQNGMQQPNTPPPQPQP